MPFHLTVLGCSGGPLEGGTCAYLIKDSSVGFRHVLDNALDNEVIAVDLGSGMMRLCEMVLAERSMELNSVAKGCLAYYNQSLSVEQFTSKSVQRTDRLGLEGAQGSVFQIVTKLSSHIKTYLLTHPHLDHVGSLAINSPSFGANSGKTIHGFKSSCEALQRFIFNDTIWPDLVSERNGTLVALDTVEHAVPKRLNENYTITPFKVKHGCKKPDPQIYESTAFLIRHHRLNKAILIFGDLEADIHLKWNKLVWTNIAPMIVRRELRTIVIECSTANVPSTQPLYGHMTPRTLFQELLVLKEIVMALGYKPGLKDVEFLITHIKDQPMEIDPKLTILQQLQSLNSKHQLGVNFTILLPGQTYTVE